MSVHKLLGGNIFLEVFFSSLLMAVSVGKEAVSHLLLASST
jgi:hypothetical protein